MLTAVLRRPTRGESRIASLVAFNRGAGDLAAAAGVAAGLCLAGAIDTSDDVAGRRRRPISPIASMSPPVDVDPRRNAGAARRSRRPRARDARNRRARRARPESLPEWWDVAGTRTIVSTSTKLALLEALRPAGAHAGAGPPVARPPDRGDARRRLPPFADDALDGAVKRPAALRSRRAVARRSNSAHDRGRATDRRARRGHDGAGARCADGREIDERHFDLPALPIGRHRLEVGGVACALTIAPPEAYRAQGGVAAPLRRLRAALRAAPRRHGDQGIGDFTTLGLAGAAAAQAGAAYFGVSPMHMLFPARSQPREPLSPVRPALSRSDPDRRARGRRPAERRASSAAAARAGSATARGGRAAARHRLRGGVERSSGSRCRARFAAFVRARAARPGDPLFAEFAASSPRAAKRCAASPSSRRSRRERTAKIGAAGPRTCATPMRTRLAGAAAAARRRRRLRAVLPMARRSAIGRGGGAREGGGARNRPLSRSRGRRRARRRGELVARRRTRASAPASARRPIRSPRQGQNWHLPPPDPIAGARDGLARARCAARRQHAPRRHAAHRSRDGADAAVRHPRRRQAGRRRLCRLSRRTN